MQSVFPIPHFIERTLQSIADDKFVILTELAAVGMLRRKLMVKDGDWFTLTPSALAYIDMYRKLEHNRKVNAYKQWEGVKYAG